MEKLAQTILASPVLMQKILDMSKDSETDFLCAYISNIQNFEIKRIDKFTEMRTVHINFGSKCLTRNELVKKLSIIAKN